MRNGYLGRFTGGGSSVLVVFLMLLLVTLGVLALSSTTNNLNMVTRGADWVRSYYALESLGEYLLELVSHCLSQSGKEPDPFAWEPSFSNVSLARHIDGILREFLDESYAHDQDDIFIQSLLVEEVSSSKALITVDICQELESSRRHLSIRMEAGYPSIDKLSEGAIEVFEWKQYQDPFEYESSLDLWK